MTGKWARRKPGHVRRLRSGRYRASYVTPHGRRRAVRGDDGRPLTFETRQLAQDYIARVLVELQAERWDWGSIPVTTIWPRTISPLRDNGHAAWHDTTGLRISL